MKKEKSVIKKRIDSFISKDYAKNLGFFSYPQEARSLIKNPTRNFWKKQIENGLIKFNNKKIKASFRIDCSAKNFIYFDWKNIQNNWFLFHQKKFLPWPGSLEKIFENQNLIVFNKPAPLAVHSRFPLNYNRKREVTLVDLVQSRFARESRRRIPQSNERDGLVHRLDKETSGVMLFAKNGETEKFLKNSFKKRLIEKKYLALVEGDFQNKKFQVRGWIGKNRLSPISQSFSKSKQQAEEKIINPKESLSRFEVIASGKPNDLLKKSFYGQEIYSCWRSIFGPLLNVNKFYSLIKADLITGRTHQIRVHLSSLGFPILGDRLYGNKKIKNTAFYPCHALHSYELYFKNQRKELIKLKSDKVSLF